jgi:hypothetical protein
VRRVISECHFTGFLKTKVTIGYDPTDAAGLRAAAVVRYFFCAERFADLLVVFHMPAACV